MNEPISVLAVEANLRKLLVRAREVKVANSLEPAVPASEIRADVALLFKDVFAFQPDSFKFVVVETAARKVFYDLVVSFMLFDHLCFAEYTYSTRLIFRVRNSFMYGIFLMF